MPGEGNKPAAPFSRRELASSSTGLLKGHSGAATPKPPEHFTGVLAEHLAHPTSSCVSTLPHCRHSKVKEPMAAIPVERDELVQQTGRRQLVDRSHGRGARSLKAPLVTERG